MVLACHLLSQQFWLKRATTGCSYDAPYFCQIESILDIHRVLLGEPVLVLGGEVVVVVEASFEL